MKKTFTVSFLFLFLSVTAFSQIVEIPDANFKTYLLGNESINTNSDTEIQLSEAVAFDGTINCNGLNVSDFTGIEEFINLTVFYSSDNNFASGIDLSLNTALEEIRITTTNLSSLDLSQNAALETLELSYNSNMTAIDVSTCPNLRYLYCGSCDIIALDLSSNVNLLHLYCNDNSLSALDLSANTLLEILLCSDNGLLELDVSNNPGLIGANCAGNYISTLDFSMNPSLVQIICVANSLNSLNLSNISTSAFLNATENPQLTCIQVDDVAAAEAAWTSIDATASFSTDCNISFVDQLHTGNNVSIYPNPTHSNIFIQTDLNIKSMVISDARGSIIMKNIPTNRTIDLSELSTGLYFLQAFTEGGWISKKLILE
ncbi:MAG: T9SS type A sorting domain-containing protein [Flavobacteriales bacterium]